MKFLSNKSFSKFEPKDSLATDYQAGRCIPGTVNDLECCQHNVYFWAHYNPDRSCCGPDGVKALGDC